MTAPRPTSPWSLAATVRERDAGAGAVTEPPAWAVAIDRSLAAPRALRPPPLLDAVRAHPLAPFLSPLQPLAQDAHDRVRAGARALAAAHADAPFDPDTIVEVLWPSGAEQLLRRVGRTFVLELAIARLEGRLDGASPEARFASFVRELEDPARLRALLAEYPVLARQLVLALDRWVDTSLELCAHLAADAAALRARFAPDRELGVLVGATSGGDLHRGGRAVRVLRFASGLRVVHKPRPVGIELHFGELCAWLGARGDVAFRPLAIVARGDHGWVEHVEATPCADRDGVRRFHERLGALLAILSVLGGTDMHHENLIACGEHPVLIDLEGLFHPDPWKPDQLERDHAIHHALVDSVLGVGLLPWRVWADARRAGIDIGGLAQMAGQRTPFPGPVWRLAGTDRMYLDREHETLPADQNRPTLAGAQVDAIDYVDELVAGFERMYRVILAHRDALIAPTGPLAAFEGDESRVILRGTMTYANLLQESFHPDVLRDAADRDAMWDQLWALVEHRPSLGAVVEHERADLHQGDIPMFVTSPSARHLRTSRGEPIAGFPVLETGLERARRCLARMGDDDLARQTWLVRASMATEAPSGKAITGPHPRLGDDRASPAELVARARAIGDRLAATAIASTDGHAATWIALAIRDGGRAVIEQQNADLYDGLPGTALFLAHLGAITGADRYTALARAAVETIRRQLDRPAYRPQALGALVGWGGVLYTWAHLAAVWDDPGLLDEAAGFLDHVPALIERDVELDTSGGLAGGITGLLALGGRRALALARTCGDRLLACARAMPVGLGWIQPGIAAQSLTGFAHGNAGRALALFELAAATGDRVYRRAAIDALAHERARFVPEAGNWPDLRTAALAHHAPDQPPPCRVSWCHGAPGIGLARLATLAHHDDAALRGEIEIAIATTRARGFGDNHSLCHGDLGNLELFLVAGAALGVPAWNDEAYRHAAAILRDLDARGVRCGVPRGVETPGVFTGIAGIGYELLRLAAPARVPSLLALAPPSRRRAARSAAEAAGHEVHDDRDHRRDQQQVHGE